MSVTAQAIPFMLISGFISVINSIYDGANTETEKFTNINQNIEEILKENQYNITDEVKEEVIKTICKEYQTVFMSKEVLLKTLDEHGFENITTDNKKITCSKDFFNLEFWQNNATSPYTMKIDTNCTEEDTIELINNINSEYTSNTQEENYIKIKERLEKKGLKISEEEVFEDDTIVLTVNID